MEKIRATEFFAPDISADTAAFWEGCKEHKLVLQKCKKCGKLRWPAAYLCPNCLSEETELCELSGEGVIYSYAIYYKPFHPSVADKVPYVVAEVDLKEGARLVSNIVDCELSELKCGLPVEVRFIDGEGYARPVFVLKK